MFSLFSWARDERVILATIGVATFGIISVMTVILTTIRDENEIKIPQPKTQYITQETEDSLKLETLDKLMEHPNYSIREVATRILCDRAVNDPAVMNLLIYGIAQPDYEHRLKCFRALETLTGQTLDALSKLHTPKAYSALVRSLEMSLQDVPPSERPKLDDPHWDEYFLRDKSEKFCLMFINELITKHGATLLLNAGFVEKWLARQNWGDSDIERQKNFADYVSNANKDNTILDIVRQIRDLPQGRKALRKAKLIVREPSPSRAVKLLKEGPENEQQSCSRGREQTEEGQRIRRQHREAMVLSDGTSPIGREHIIERGHSI